MTCTARLFILLLVISPSLYAGELNGRVIGIADGDTFTLLTADKQQVKIRLAEIDAPEGGQPYGNKSKQKLSELVFGKDVRVITQTTDHYGRTFGWPRVGDIDVCEEMVRSGSAWVYRQYVVHDDLFTIENEARNAKRGLWGLSKAQNMPPWEWRREGGTQGAPEGCLIKGNINRKGDKIYHAPGMRSYGEQRSMNRRVSSGFVASKKPGPQDGGTLETSVTNVRFAPGSRHSANMRLKGRL